MRRPLNETVQVRLDGSGNGTASIGPISAREKWYPDMVHVQCATNASEATCTIYQGDAAQQRNFRDWTASGSSGDSSDRVFGPMGNPLRVWAVWAGGDPLAVATMVVSGEREVS